MLRRMILVSALFLGVAHAREKVVTFAVIESKPWSFTDHKVQDNLCPAGGSIVKLTRDLIQRLGYRLRCLVLPWLRAQQAVEEGKADLMWTMSTPKRLSYSVLVPESLAVTKVRAFTWANNLKTKPITAFHGSSDPQFAGLLVGTYTGNKGWMRTNMGEDFVKKLRFVVNTANVGALLKSGHLDVYISVVPQEKKEISRAHMKIGSFRLLRIGVKAEDIPFFYFVSKKSILVKENRIEQLTQLVKTAKAEGKVHLIP